MKRAFILVAVLITLPLFARSITEKDLFRFVWIADPQMSSDGSHVAFVRVTVNAKKDGYDTAIWSVPVRGGEAPQRMTNGPHDTSPRWSTDGKQLAFLRATEKDGKPQPAQIYLLSMSGGEPHAVSSIAKGASSIAWSPHGDVIAFLSETKPEDADKKKDDDAYESDVRIINQATYRENGQGYNDPTRQSHIWTIHPFDEKAQPKQITSGEFDEEGPVWSADGSRIYFVSTRVREPYYQLERSELYSVPADGGDITRVAAIDGGVGRISPSPDGKWIVFGGTITTPARSYDQPDLFVVSTTPGSTPRNLTASYDYDVLSGPGGDQRAPRGGGRSQPLWTKDGHSVIVNTAERGAANLVSINIDSGKVTPITTGNHDVQAWTYNVVLVSTPTIIGDLYRIENGGQLVRITDVNKTLFDELTLTEPDELTYPSFDGKQVQTWIQKPPDYQQGKRYPLILNIHGGPHGAYGYTF
ncbi:MAG TPA: S9 family peptidase, partial [Thermoanaerobaculia bacterium]